MDIINKFNKAIDLLKTKYLMRDKLNFNKDNKNTIYIHYSTEEETYASDIKPLLEEMKNINLKVIHDKKSYSSHAELTLYFPSYIKNSIKSILGGSIW